MNGVNELRSSELIRGRKVFSNHRCGTETKRHERQRSVGAATGDASRCSDYEQVVVVVGSAVLVAHARLGIVAHLASTGRVVLKVTGPH